MAEARTLPAGTLVHINGIPCWLTEAATLETHPANWELALEKLSESEPEST